jgi:hypothetical protein
VAAEYFAQQSQFEWQTPDSSFSSRFFMHIGKSETQHFLIEE